MIQNFSGKNNYASSLHQDGFKAYPRESAHSTEPVDYVMDFRGAMLAFDPIPTFKELHQSTTSFIV